MNLRTLLLLIPYVRHVLSATDLFFSAPSAILELDSPFLVAFSSGESANPATFALPSAADATVSGDTKTPNVYTLNIEFKKSVTGSAGTLDSSSLTFEMTLDDKTSYWTLSKLETAFKGQVNDKAVDLTEVMNVAPRTGYTTQKNDVSCERGYTTCAPKNLCWTCSNQTFVGSPKNSTGTSMTATLLMPGLKLQPNTQGSTHLTKFGYVWDCDPLIPLSVWIGFILTLLLTFAVYWAIDMLTGLYTPDKFDDPKGQGIAVPNKE